jgi:glycosyltransferase involved in cell wall biosynthesis
VVVPCFRTGPALETALDRLTSVLEATSLNWEVIVVADGDVEAFRMAAQRRSPNVRVFGYRTNRGKGFALRFGVDQCQGDLVTFLDADMQVAPEEIGRMVELLRLYDADVVVGSKRHPMSDVSYPWTRRFQSLSYQLLVRMLFQVKVRDTQTGLKVMRRDVAASVIERALVKRFAFDLELLTIATHLGHRRIIEAPVTIEAPFSSTTNAKAAAHVLQDTLAIFYRLRILRWYDRDGEHGLRDLRASIPDRLHIP